MQESDQGELSLKTLRERTGLSQEKLGRKLDLSFRTIADWEAGKKVPRADNFLALCRELGVSPKTLAKAMKLDVEGVPDDESD